MSKLTHGAGKEKAKKSIKKTHAFTVRIPCSSLKQGLQEIKAILSKHYDKFKVTGSLSPSTASQCKAKSRKLQNWVAAKYSWVSELPWGKDCPIEPRQMGETGPDVRLDAEARKRFPFTMECKNTENWSLPAAIKQAQANIYPDTDWLVVLMKNRTKPVVVLDADRFFELLKEAKNG